MMKSQISVMDESRDVPTQIYIVDKISSSSTFPGPLINLNTSNLFPIQCHSYGITEYVRKYTEVRITKSPVRERER